MARASPSNRSRLRFRLAAAAISLTIAAVGGCSRSPQCPEAAVEQVTISRLRSARAHR